MLFFGLFFMIISILMHFKYQKENQKIRVYFLIIFLMGLGFVCTYFFGSNIAPLNVPRSI